ncbi:hypothetical protein [Streptomyces sp. KL116D]|uniref:hypothetical protein n=1 Tax=Streptomyces sp. KL116D TaxID=3045152 RepID=UPI003559123C
MTAEPRTPQPTRRDDLTMMLLHGGAATNAIAKHVVDAFEAEVRAQMRDEVADEIHRAELPTFAETENPVLVAKTVRAIDWLLADRGPEAPYWTPKAGEQR